MGFEVEIAAAPTDRLTLTGGIGYLDTEIESNDFARISGNLSVGLQGVDLPRSPEWSLNATADYRWPWETHELYVRGEWIFKDSQFSTIEDTTFEETSGIAIPIDPSMPATGANVAARVPDRSDGFPVQDPGLSPGESARRCRVGREDLAECLRRQRIRRRVLLGHGRELRLERLPAAATPALLRRQLELQVLLSRTQRQTQALLRPGVRPFFLLARN